MTVTVTRGVRVGPSAACARPGPPGAGDSVMVTRNRADPVIALLHKYL